MLTCPKCKIAVAGDKECCPLCQGELTGTADRDPYLPPKRTKYSRFFVLKLISFSAVALIIIATALNMMIRPDIWWSLFAVVGVACVWPTVAIGFTYRKRLFKNLTFQLFIITFAAVLWDLFVGWQGWSLDYVLPCTCMAYMITVFVLSRVMEGPRNSYIIYLVLDCVYGLVPIVLVLLRIVRIPYPSVSCAALSLISIFGLLFFQGKALKEEIQKKLHV